MLTVYHGSTYRVEQPLAGVCRPNLDFGVGFYLTDLKDQAIRWALRTADIRHEKSVWLNIYSLDIDALFALYHLRCTLAGFCCSMSTRECYMAGL